MAATSQPNVPSETEILAGLDKIRLRRLIAFGPFSVFLRQRTILCTELFES